MAEPVIIVLAWSLGLPAVIFAILGLVYLRQERRRDHGPLGLLIRLQDLDDHEPPAERRHGGGSL